MKTRLRVLGLVLLSACLPADALAWWPAGHNCICRAAVRILPDDMPAFFRKSGADIASYASDPDLWKNRSLPALTAAERANHYLDMELLRRRAATI